MKSLELIENICFDYKNEMYTIEEFQQRLRTIMIEDEFSSNLLSFLNDIDNKLEEIRFCSLEINHYKYGVEVANLLIEKVKKLKYE